MADFKIYKEVSSLPVTLDPNAIYLVRTGEGFDLYCSDITGDIAHKINSDRFFYPPSRNLNIVAGNFYSCERSTGQENSHSIGLVGHHFTPVLFDQDSTIDQLGLRIINARSGLITRICLYNSHPTTKLPYQLIAQTVNLNSETVGFKVGSISSTAVSKDRLYYFAVTASAGNGTTLMHISPFLNFKNTNGEPHYGLYIDISSWQSSPTTILGSSFLSRYLPPVNVFYRVSSLL